MDDARTHAYLVSLRASRIRLDYSRSRLEVLEANPALVPTPVFEPRGRSGYYRDRVQNDALRNMACRELCRRTIRESYSELRRFKGLLEESDLNDLARAVLWARYGMGLGWREVGKRLGMSTVHAYMMGRESVEVIAGDLPRA